MALKPTYELLLKKETFGKFNVEMNVLINSDTGRETFHIYLCEGHKELIYTRIYTEEGAEAIYQHFKECTDSIGKEGYSMKKT